MKTALLFAIVLVLSQRVAAQDTSAVSAADIALSDNKPDHDTLHYFYEPRPLERGKHIFNIGLVMSLLPAPLVEQEVPAPSVDFQYRYGLAPWISLYGSLSTNYFTNLLMLGARFNTGDEDLSFSIGDAMVFFAGYLDLGGEFDRNTAAAVATLPIMQVGHKFESLAVSLSAAASYVIYADMHVGSLEDKTALRSRVNDIYMTLAFEQPFFGNHLVSTGFSVTYSRTPYQIWMLYNTFDQYLVVPEFFFAFQL